MTSDGKYPAPRPLNADVEGGGEVKAKVVTKVMIWDLPLRIFHWSLLATVAIAGFTGFAAPASWLDTHLFAGYALAILLVFRLAWGVLGSHYSTFRSFPLAPRSAFRHIRSLLRNSSAAHTGHNPVGAWMIIAILFLLSALVLTGLIVLGGQENIGPLGFLVDFQTGWRAAALHEIAAWGLAVAIAVHLLGVFVEARLLRHSVLSAMITGNKLVSPAKAKGHGRSYTARGLTLFAIAALLLLGGGKILASIPASGWKPVQAPAAYSAECGDCHDAYHPSLRTAASWRGIMSGLSDHYGEDASLDAETAAAIGSFLAANAAETFDTEAAWRMGRIDTKSLRITDTPYWTTRHAGIADGVFKLSGIGSKVNCNGCHRDAASGRFADQDIHLPNLPNGSQK
ncbi:MAG: cytochrome b/b6 domain-containing protein [Alphaproteobacteria bacterium]|nr:cytochrome b/b6 domain-containing protein [Alphaproteobacteria bacterium]